MLPREQSRYDGIGAVARTGTPMKIRTLLLILFILLVAGFVALNFAQILQPTALSFGFTEVQAPLGLVLLGMLALVLVVFLAALVYQQTTHMMEVRRITREASDAALVYQQTTHMMEVRRIT
eukprot:gene16734-34803_t